MRLPCLPPFLSPVIWVRFSPHSTWRHFNHYRNVILHTGGAAVLSLFKTKGTKIRITEVSYYQLYGVLFERHLGVSSHYPKSSATWNPSNSFVWQTLFPSRNSHLVKPGLFPPARRTFQTLASDCHLSKMAESTSLLSWLHSFLCLNPKFMLVSR